MSEESKSTPSFPLPSTNNINSEPITRLPSLTSGFTMSREEEQRWLTRREGERSDLNLPTQIQQQQQQSSSSSQLPQQQQQQQQQQSQQQQQPYHHYQSPGYLRQPAPLTSLRPQWGFNSGNSTNNNSSNSNSSSASTSTNSYIPSAQSNSFNQSYQPLPYPSPVSPAFAISNPHNSNSNSNSNTSNNNNSSNLPSQSNLQHQAFQPMLPGTWLPALTGAKHLVRDSTASTSILPIASNRESFPGMYEKNDTRPIVPPPVIPIVSSTGGSGPQTAVKPFAAKLAFLLANPNLYADLIMWDEAGTCFILAHSVERLSEEVLPLLFSHNSSTAFRRQLNIYNFVHLTSQQLTKKFRNSTISVPIKHCSGWQHPYFTKDNPSTLHLLRPKPSRARRLHQLSREKKVLENVIDANRGGQEERGGNEEGDDEDDDEGEGEGNAEASGSGNNYAEREEEEEG